MIKITKAEYEVLPESLKAKFKAEGEEYALIEEDVDGLKKSKAEILEEKKRIQAERDELAKFKQEHDAKASQEEQALLEKKGEFDKLLEAKQKAFEDRMATETAEREKIQANLKAERWQNFLTENGVNATRLKALKDLQSLYEKVELANEDGLPLKIKNGVGDAAELKGEIAKLIGDAPFLTDSKLAAGSGASGSQQNGGSSILKTATRAQVDAMSPSEKKAFYLGDGEVSD